MITFLKRGAQIILSLVVLGWFVTFLAVKFESHEYTELSAEQRVRAAEYLDGKVTPAPSGWTFETFTPEQGVILRTGSVDAPNAKGTVVLVPGFTGTIEMSMETISQFNRSGFRVAAIEYRGQGKSYRPLSLSLIHI